MSQSRVIAEHYELVEQIDSGGMGDVYRAVDTITDTPVAVKVLKPQVVAEDPTLVDRFRREAAALRKLNHPNIVRVLETIEQGGRSYIVMEFIPGGSLAELIQREGKLPIMRALQIALDLADALTRTHRLDIIHRDLKPANVLLAADGSPRLTDFGVAKVQDGQSVKTQVGTLIGTIAYLSPEACEGKPYNEKTDIWAFGMIVYEMLAGQHPFADETSTTGMLNAILNEPIADILELRPDVPFELHDLVHAMLAKNPDNRIASVRLVGAQIESILNDLRAAEVDAAASPLTPPPASRFTPTPAASIPAVITPTPPPISPANPPTIARRVIDPRIFIAYRREDSGEVAGRLYERLAEAFGDTNVVRDVDRIADRTISRFVLAQDVLGSVDVMLVIIGPQWAGLPGRRSIDSPKDAVRVQIEAGLKRPDVLIIPVLVNGASMPQDLPPSLQGLADKHPFIMGSDTDGQSRRLINRIKEHFGLKRRLPVIPIAVVAALVFLLIVSSALMMSQRGGQVVPTVVPVAADQYMVLVADLEPVRTEARDVSRFISDDLQQQLENNVPSSPIRVRRYAGVITSADDALRAASANGATVVVWGSYTGDQIELQVQSGVTTAFDMQMQRDPVDRLATMRVHMTDERQQTVAPMVLTVLTLLHNGEGDGFELVRTLTILSQIDAPPAEIVGADAAALNYRALQLFIRDTPQAIDQLNTAIGIDGANPLLYLFRASAYQRLGDYDTALNDIGTAQRLGGDSWTSPYYLLANDATFRGGYDTAISFYTHIVDARPDDWFPPNYRGGLHYLKGDYGQAKADLDRSLALHPTANFPYPIATMIALREGRIGDARALMQTVLTEFPDPSEANRIIAALYGDQNALIWGPIFSAFTNQVIGQYENVVRDTEAALALNNQLSDLYLIQGFAYCNLRRYPESEAAYTEGLDIEPNYPLLHLLRAEVRRNQNNLIGALADVADAREANLSTEFNALLDDSSATCENFWEMTG